MDKPKVAHSFESHSILSVQFTVLPKFHEFIIRLEASIGVGWGGRPVRPRIDRTDRHEVGETGGQSYSRRDR